MAKYLLLLLVSILGAAASALSRSCNQAYSVIDYGAVGDGDTDDTQAFKDAWKDVCRSSSCSPIIQVPGGKTFLLQPLTFNGECKPDQIIFQLDGTIKAPSDPNDWNCHGNKYCKQWITFDEVANLVIRGSGTVDGRGSTWWERHSSCKAHKHKDKRVCGKKPTPLEIAPTPMEFISSMPKHIFIDHSRIMTGDDCISIGDGSSQINISRIACGPGHGISIGSLGIDGENETVEDVHVSFVVFTETTNGARIKTWQSSAVKISNIRYENIYGTSRRKPAVHIACSKAVPCTDILLNNIHLEAVDDDDDDGDEPSAFCSNVQGHAMGHVFPPLPCLS
ncbi:PECTIN LYASE-LIKE SUPERFAMILY PROTEIN [Salix koriyanagi]|uniref:PECTIN LYASE-LIKE SUPERFAMILY PROTEIN n=1 Tax=Salix koriyanagi TaxID=2511006 RepID=A0A9Q0ST87_9ROSI|nr:PECTIN LYASE-LIKE SUPERFAMILY PROTEIN [Salix koriyanagi]